LLGFNLIRSNPQICGYNLTGLLDHGFTGEGLWTYWREWKPGIADALRDGWAPLRWCLFVAPMHGYLNRPFKVEAVLANESVLAPGDYPVTFRIAGPHGVVWEQAAVATIPQPAPGEDGPLAVPVFAGEVTLEGPPGQYVFAADMRGAAPLGGRLNFYLSESPADAALTMPVALWGIDARVAEWLQVRGVTCESWTPGQVQPVILVGNPAEDQSDDAHWTTLWEEVSRGAAAVFLAPQAFKQGADALARFPLATKGRLYDFPDWLYHKECVSKPHPIFAGLQPKGVMDWDYYGPGISHLFLEGVDLPEETIAVAFALCHSAPPGGYASGVMIGVYPHGKGRFIFNTFNVLGNIDAHPAADRLLLNLLGYARVRGTTARE